MNAEQMRQIFQDTDYVHSSGTPEELRAAEYLKAEAEAIERLDGGFRLRTPKGDFTARYVLNCAGVTSDRVANLVGDHSFHIQPNKGEYFLLDKAEGNRVGRVIFQCPTKVGKGVLVAPTVHGNLLVGPSAAPTCPGDTANSADGLAFVRASAQRAVPGINFRENIRNFAGVRANSDRDDFIIEESRVAPGFIHLAGIRSPGLTAAPAIGIEALELLKKAGLSLQKKAEFVDSRRRIRFSGLPL